MAQQSVDNRALEEAIAVFREDKERASYVRVMELLEHSMVLVPAMPPEDMPPELAERMQAGKPVQLPGDAKIMPCLLRKETGEQALPIFTAPDKIPPEKRSPVLVGMHFMACVGLVMGSQGKISEIAINPFTGLMVLSNSILEVAEKRRKAVMAQGKSLQMTKEQFADFAHNRVFLFLLPKYLFEHGEEGMRQLQREEGALLLRLYGEVYPQGQSCGLEAEEFSLMPLQISDDIRLIRLDLPEKAQKKGLCYRAYAVWKQEVEELLYYAFERTKDGAFIAQITPGGGHELLVPVPDNGAEIEAILRLAAPE